MLLAVLCLCFFSSTACYHLTPESEEHSTTLDYLRTTNKTVNALLEGKLEVKCVACEVFVETLQILVQLNASSSEIVSLITKACIILKIEDERVCSYITEEFRDEFVTVLFRLILHPTWLCYAAIGPSCGEPPDIFTFWNVTIPGNKPTGEPLVRPKDGLPTLKVVQLSDVHIDLQYTPGSVKKCGEPLCCRDGKGLKDDEAGFWGSMNAPCDIPLRTYKNALEFISQQIKPEVIFWTGDIPAHDVWKQSRADQLQHIQVTADLMSQYFPDTRVYPSLGNHESSPVDSFPPPGVTTDHLSNNWLNNFVQKVWSRWLPPESLSTIGYAGYYAVQYSERLRIISLNTQYCDNLNFWLYLNNRDPANMLAWLVAELSWAEGAGVKVVILGHIPTGRSDCMKAFSWNYYRIIDRFESTVVGQYMGHTHQDHFSMMYSEEPDHHPTAFQFISPSLTTYSNLRPSIRVYTLDGIHRKSTFRPLKSETWLLDLDRANEKNETVWELEYDSQSAYNMTWLVPDTMHQLYKTFQQDRGFFEKTFWKFKFHDQPNMPCDDNCYRNNLCEMITGRSRDPNICKDISLDKQEEFFLRHNMC
ncbi:sphingomyelin phosphodiesterase-like [Bolinopsis microptera]|uniref:sphingomyelin phosphodiesterase-like n=1 Tax=Bolinopsis microptera TaxID=2820187 RepID=UPI00307950E2